MPIPSSQGVSCSFGSVTFAATNIKVKRKGKTYDKQLDVSTLAIEDGGNRVYEDQVLNDPNELSTEVTCTYLGDSEPDTENEQSLTVSGLNVSGNARCTEFELEAAVGEKIKGSATFVIPG